MLGEPSLGVDGEAGSINFSSSVLSCRRESNDNFLQSLKDDSEFALQTGECCDDGGVCSARTCCCFSFGGVSRIEDDVDGELKGLRKRGNDFAL